MKMSKKTKRFFHMVKMDLLRLAVYAIMLFLAVFAVCFVLSLPEMIGMLIFG